MAQRLRGTDGGGIPWMVILDANGEELITSDGRKGNVGYPVLPHEIEHFIVMLRTTARQMTADQIVQIEESLNERAKKYRRQQVQAP